MENPFDLRAFLAKIEAAGQLARIPGALLDGEVGALTELNARRGGPALLFSGFEGFPEGFRLLSGAMLNPATLGAALGVEARGGSLGLLRETARLMKRAAARAGDFPVQYLEDGPIFENVLTGAQVDVTRFPVPLWHPGDGGRYIGTGCVNVQADPDTGWVNLGTYRSMVHDRRTVTTYVAPGHHGAAIMRKYWARGEPCPVVLVPGLHPLLFAMGATDAPAGVCEYEWAGAIAGRRVPVVRGRVTGLPIPAWAEVALEGYIRPGDTAPEGPFGEFTGYYAGGRSSQSCIRVEAVYHRDEPILLGSPPGRPPHDYSYFGSMLRSANLLNAMEAAGLPGLRGVWIHEAAASRCFTAVSIEQQYPGHASQAAALAGACQPGALMNKYVVVVDEDIDPTKLDEVVWAISTRSDPARDIDILRECLSSAAEPTLRPEDRAAGRVWTGRALIRAVRPYDMVKGGAFSPVAETPPELLRAVQEKYSALLGPSENT